MKKFKQVIVLSVLLAPLYSYSGTKGGGNPRIMEQYGETYRTEMYEKEQAAKIEEERAFFIDYLKNKFQKQLVAMVKDREKTFGYSESLGNPEARKVFFDLLKKGLIEDIENTKLDIKTDPLKEECFNEQGDAQALSTTQGVPKADICVDIDSSTWGVRPDIRKDPIGFSKMAGIFLHDFARHLGYDDAEHSFAYHMGVAFYHAYVFVPSSTNEINFMSSSPLFVRSEIVGDLQCKKLKITVSGTDEYAQPVEMWSNPSFARKFSVNSEVYLTYLGMPSAKMKVKLHIKLGKKDTLKENGCTGSGSLVLKFYDEYGIVGKQVELGVNDWAPTLEFKSIWYDL